MCFMSPSSTGGRDAVTVYQIDEVVEPDIYSELGCYEDPNPGPDGGRVRDIVHK